MNENILQTMISFSLVTVQHFQTKNHLSFIVSSIIFNSKIIIIVDFYDIYVYKMLILDLFYVLLHLLLISIKLMHT